MRSCPERSGSGTLDRLAFGRITRQLEVGQGGQVDEKRAHREVPSRRLGHRHKRGTESEIATAFRRRAALDA